MIFKALLQSWVHSESIGFIDLNAGPGFYYKKPTLSIRFIEAFLESMSPESTQLQTILCEINPTYNARLCNSIKKTLKDVIERNIICHITNDNVEVEVMEFDIPFPDKGLILSDPNGIPDFEYLKRLRSKFPKLDTVIHLNYVSVCRHAWRNGKMETTGYLDKLGYVHWYTSDTFSDKVILLGSNEVYPEIIKEGFHHIDSSIGKSIFTRLNSRNAITHTSQMSVEIVRKFST